MDCPICKEKFNQGSRLPKILPCGHTICLNCIPLIYANNVLHCPEDNSEFAVAEEELKTNFIVFNSIEEPAVQLKCCNGHELEPLREGPVMKCEKCFKKRTEYCKCSPCVYIVCKLCYY